MKFAARTRSNRLVILDQLRGLCLAIIIVDHIGLFPTLFEVFTGRQALWITAAEGFFLISGLLVGLIRHRQMDRDGFKGAARAVWSRAGKLYLATVILTLLYTCLAYTLNNAGISGSKHGLAYFGSLPELVWRSITLTYSYGWSDFLVYYVVYMVLAPVVLWLLGRRLWSLVLTGAVAGWLLPWFWPVFIAGLRWQAYFFVGMVIGFHHDWVRRWWQGLPAVSRRRTAQLAATGTVLGLAISAMVTNLPQYFWGNHSGFFETLRTMNDDPQYQLLFNNDRTGILRLPFFVMVFGAFYLTFQRYQPWVRRRLNWLLEPLGKNSLYVYIVQGAAVFLVRLIAPPNNFWLNTAVDAAVVLAIWWLVKKRFLFKVIPR